MSLLGITTTTQTKNLTMTSVVTMTSTVQISIEITENPIENSIRTMKRKKTNLSCPCRMSLFNSWSFNSTLPLTKIIMLERFVSFFNFHLLTHYIQSLTQPMQLDNENASTEAGPSETLPQETTATEIAQVIYNLILSSLVKIKF